MATRVRGLDRLKRQLSALPNSVRAAMSDALADGAAEMAGAIRRAAPRLDVATKRRRPGALQDSVGSCAGPPPKTSATGALRGKAAVGNHALANWALDDAGLLYSVYAGNDEAYYARWVEFGTAPSTKGQRVGARASDVKQSKQGRIAGRTHPGHRAQPFFYPNVRAKRKAVKAKVMRATRKAAKAIAALK